MPYRPTSPEPPTLQLCLSSSPSTLFMDNNSAIAVAKNPAHFGRLKHMLADLLTKPLAPVRVEQLRRLLGLE